MTQKQFHCPYIWELNVQIDISYLYFNFEFPSERGCWRGFRRGNAASCVRSVCFCGWSVGSDTSGNKGAPFTGIYQRLH